MSNPLFVQVESCGLTLDARAMRMSALPGPEEAEGMERALAEMADLEAGAIANADEGRRVGHYWLRAPELAPEAEIRRAIEEALGEMRQFVDGLGERYREAIVVGIGGSALGPQLLAQAIEPVRPRRRLRFLDNTDPDGLARLLRQLRLDETMVLVVSKSGGTPETRNGMLILQEAYARASLDLPGHAVAITTPGSDLDARANKEWWLGSFPIWDWVGGRTSITSAVGVLPAMLQGADAEALLVGARAMDEVTRQPDQAANPAALLARAWYDAGGGRGDRAMVVLPYRDRLLLLGRYLQQLVMESLGKRLDRRGGVVEQGLTVFGNKGSTDQHAFVQQLREGRDDFFVTFIEVLADAPAERSREDWVGRHEVEPEIRAGDYLSGFLAGTRRALTEAGRRSLTITLDQLDAFRLGGLLALFERAVGLYASLIDINAYHQPGVEAGKKAAAAVLALQRRLQGELAAGATGTAAELAERLGGDADPDEVFGVLRRLAATDRARKRRGSGLDTVFGG